MLKISIGIQARLASTRLKEKSIYHLTDRTVVTHLLDRVFNAVHWMAKKPERNRLVFDICLLTPEVESAFWNQYSADYNTANATRVRNISGSMDDVFSRYAQMVSELRPHYIIRLTADCPLIPSPLISKAINIAVMHRLDFISNAIPDLRTMPDGYDVEVLSQECFFWLKDNLLHDAAEDREHVTTYLKNNFQKWMRVAIISTNVDQFCPGYTNKYSIDTAEDFVRVQRVYESKIEKDAKALARGFGVYEY